MYIPEHQQYHCHHRSFWYTYALILLFPLRILLFDLKHEEQATYFSPRGKNTMQMGTSNSFPKGSNTKTMLSLDLCAIKAQWPLPNEFTVKYITEQPRDRGKRER